MFLLMNSCHLGPVFQISVFCFYLQCPHCNKLGFLLCLANVPSVFPLCAPLDVMLMQVKLTCYFKTKPCVSSSDEIMAANRRGKCDYGAHYHRPGFVDVMVIRTVWVEGFSKFCFSTEQLQSHAGMLWELTHSLAFRPLAAARVESVCSQQPLLPHSTQRVHYTHTCTRGVLDAGVRRAKPNAPTST